MTDQYIGFLVAGEAANIRANRSVITTSQEPCSQVWHCYFAGCWNQHVNCMLSAAELALGVVA